MKTHLITFGHPSQYTQAGERLCISAKNYFDTTKCFSLLDLDTEFYKDFSGHLRYKRGFGYWCWKPYIIKKTLEKVQDGDVVMYTDAACEFLADPKPLLDICNHSGAVFFGVPGDHPNEKWTHDPCFVAMECDTEKHRKSPQTNAAFQLYKKNEESLSFVNEYLNWAKQLVVIGDLPVGTITKPPFVDHRHDQSILSLMVSQWSMDTHRSPCQWGERVKEQYTNSNYGQLINHYRNV